MYHRNGSSENAFVIPSGSNITMHVASASASACIVFGIFEILYKFCINYLLKAVVVYISI